MKKILILVGIIIIIAAVSFFFITKDNPMVTQAKEEVRQAQALLDGFQNTVNAIPALELSPDVKNDFEIQAGFLGTMGYIVPDSEPSPKVMIYIGKMTSAVNARGSTRYYIDLDEGLGKVSRNIVQASEVTGEDLGNLEKLAHTFDVQIKQTKSAVPKLIPLTAERNRKTEKYFLEFDKIQQKLNALASSLDAYSSAGFREKIKKLKSANNLFGDIANYTEALINGRSFGYTLNVAALFPEVKSDEAKVKICAVQPGLTDCGYVGPFPGGYQEMLQKLEPLYSQLIEN